LNARKIDTQLNGNAVFLGDVTIGSTSFNIGLGPINSDGNTTIIISINGSPYIEGHVNTRDELKYSGQKSLFIKITLFLHEALNS